MRREREERKRRLKRENQDEGIKRFSQPLRNDYMPQNRSGRSYGRAKEVPQEVDPNLSKMLDSKTFQKRAVEPVGNRFTRAKVERLPEPPTSGSKKPEPHATNDFRIVRVQPYSGSSTPQEGQRSQAECLFNEVVLSLPAFDVFDFFPEDEPAEVTGTSGTMSTGLKLEASILEDYELASKAFSKFLYSVDANKLLCEPRKIIRQKALDYFIWALHIFAQARPPGIYKQDYIESLYMFYHESPENMFSPPIPEWKRSSDLDLNGEAVQDDDDNGDTATFSNLPFSERWKLLEEEVVRPRNNERKQFECEGKCSSIYRFDMEPFSVRRKDFWLLSTVVKLLKEFIPKLSHAADGLIFQPNEMKTLDKVVKGWDDPYVPRTHEGLLKWKYPELNSVDFLFEVGNEGRQLLFLFDRGEEDVTSHSGKIMECSWDADQGCWVCMRIRTDKATPNDISTYRKVMRSINDNITEEVLLGEIAEIVRLPMYADRILRAQQLQHRRR
ncbi:hypothetical protein COCNU_02G007930 [Cocos nucifera]|uniref:mRNA guanylyltransferase n=1 Tax=Cocos nucifera TaxID=13894 RepID=A0A8K0HYJ6_COCNU|nr:hypothetical protein COCNU_02G007930 [Cocos nucifera]